MKDETEPRIKTLSWKRKEYRVDEENLLIDPTAWDEDFAEGLAPEAGISGGLTERHWEVIRFIRRYWEQTGFCPTVFQTAGTLALHLGRFHFLFPSGYQRGACRLAGLSYRAEFPDDEYQRTNPDQKSYRIDIWGFLLDPDEWDERFSVLKAYEMKVPEGLSGHHWEILRFLRQEYYRNRRIPTAYDTCEAVGIDLEEFERLFPDGYHRGAVKIAGLRVLGEEKGE